MKQNLQDIWSVCSVILETDKPFTFAIIKQIVGLSGLERTKLSHLEQKYSGGASKSQLMAEIDKHINDFTDEKFQHFINIIIEEILERNIKLLPKLEKYLNRLGWKIYDNIVIPIEIFDLSELQELNEKSHKDLIKASIRFRDGDLSGAMTSICSSIDSLTTDIYNKYSLGDPNIVCFQERCNKSILAIGILDKMDTDLSSLGWNTGDISRLKKNLKSSLNQMALITQKLRSSMGDVHGTKPVLKSLVFDSFKFAQILIRMMT